MSVIAPPSIWRILGQMIRYAKRLYCADTVLWLFIIGLPILPGVLIREFFNTLTSDSESSLLVWIVLLLTVGLARVIAIFTGRVTKTQHRFLMSGLIRHNLLKELLNQPGAELANGSATGQSMSPGELLSYFRDDASQIEDAVAATNEIFAEAVFALVAITILLSVNVTMTLLVFLPLCAIAFLVHHAEHRIKRYRQASRQATQQVTGFLGELFTATQAIKVAGAEERMLRELKKRCDRRQQLTIRDRVFSKVLESGFENIVSIGTALILLVISQNISTSGNITVGDFALFVYYLSFVTYFFAFLGSFFALTQQSEVSFERMSALIANRTLPSHQTDQPIDQPVSPLTYPHSLYLKPLLKAQPSLPSINQTSVTIPVTGSVNRRLQSLQVAGLTYHYPNSNNGIHDISFRLQRGSLTVITGSIGAGKTTLLRVLLGLLPKQAGELFWNDQPIDQPDTFLVPPHAAYTPQTPQLFSLSLRENLLLGLPESQLEDAIATAAFDQDLAAMPKGLNTQIGARGIRLSGGQKQRVAAARMLVRQPELLVLDNLSSALDIETEQRLWEQLFETSYNSAYAPTYLIVSHRPALLAYADQIIELEIGRIKP